MVYHKLFCELCVEQIEAGNRPIGIMTTRGYQNIAVKYLQKTGLRHSKMQLKNRWDILKALYSFWLGLLKDTGLGWDSTQGTVSASDKYWKQVTKVIILFMKLFLVFAIISTHGLFLYF